MDAEQTNAASVALIDGDSSLLIQRSRPPSQNLWTLPGGRREPGETPEECAIRELQEELGITPRNLVLILIESIRGGVGENWRLAMFATTDFEGTIIPSEEISDHRWMRLDEVARIPTTPGLDTRLDLAFRTLTRTS